MKINEINDEIIELVKLYQNTYDDEIFFKISMKSRPIFGYIIRRLKYPAKIDKDELEQECLIALFNACKNFDVTKGKNFVSYFITAANRECYEYIQKTQNIIVYPGKTISTMNKINKFITEYQKEYACPPLESDILDGVAGITKDDLAMYYDYQSSFFYVDIYETDEDIDSIDSNVSMDLQIEVADMSGLVDDIIQNELSEKEKTVVIGRFFENKTFAAIGEELGCSRENVRIIEEKVKEKIKRRILEERGDI